MNDTTYAPQSPDLSFLSDDKSTTTSEPYRPRSPRIPGQQQQPSTQYIPYADQSRRESAYEPQYPPIPPLPNTHSQFGGGSYPQTHTVTNQPTSQYHHSFSPPSYNQSLPTYNRSSPTYQQTPSNPIPIKPEIPNNKQPSTKNAYQTQDSSYPGYASTPGKTMAQSAAGSSGSGGNGLGPSQGIEIKTKFPVARIKRIMQADEEVGKVAQVTPVAVSKALELFMISLCTKSAEVARNGNSKRITASHLKAAIEKDEQYDFLTEIVSKVADAQESGGGGEAGGAGGEKKGRGRAKAAAAAVEMKSEGDSDEVVEKKVKSTRGRKKKVEG